MENAAVKKNIGGRRRERRKKSSIDVSFYSATASHHMSYRDARDSIRDKNGQITAVDSDPACLFLMQSVMAQNTGRTVSRTI